MPPRPRLSPALTRAYAIPAAAPRPSATSPANPFTVFDRKVKRLQRDRAASDKERSRLTDYVKDEVAANMVDRLLVSPHREKGGAPSRLTSFRFSRTSSGAFLQSWILALDLDLSQSTWTQRSRSI